MIADQVTLMQTQMRELDQKIADLQRQMVGLQQQRAAIAATVADYQKYIAWKRANP